MNSAIERLLTLRVKDVMNQEVVRVLEDSTMAEAAALFTKYDITGAPVVNKQGACVGLISVSDFAYRERQLAVTAIANAFASPFTATEIANDEAAVANYMSPIVQTISPESPIMNAARLLLGEHIHRLVIVDKKQKPIGVLSSLDIVGCMVAAIEE